MDNIWWMWLTDCKLIYIIHSNLKNIRDVRTRNTIFIKQAYKNCLRCSTVCFADTSLMFFRFLLRRNDKNYMHPSCACKQSRREAYNSYFAVNSNILQHFVTICNIFVTFRVDIIVSTLYTVLVHFNIMYYNILVTN